MAETAKAFVYPLFVDLRDRLAVVVGAGSVGRRKMQGLLQAGARVRWVDPLLAEQSCDESGVEPIGRTFVETDLAGALLVIACTDVPEVNRQVLQAARQRQILCCCADQPDPGDFIQPALFRRQNLQVAVSTGGTCPFLAQEIRDRLEQQVPDSWGFSLELMASIRRKWLTGGKSAQYNQQVLRCFWAEQLLPLLEQKKMNEIDRILVNTFGSEFSLEQLQVQLPEGTP
mgnify:CR=1 FL=1